MYKQLKQLAGLYMIGILALLPACNDDDTTPPAPQDVSKHFSVERDKSDKMYRLKISQKGNWEVFAGTSPQTIDMKQAIAKGNKAETVMLSGFPSTTRMFFRYVWEKNSSAMASERLLPTEGAYNVRDLGGYKTKNGRSVKWGNMFRSGDLNKLTSNDLEYLAGVGIKTIIDFRNEDEKLAAPDKLPATHEKTYEIPIGTGNIMDMSEIKTIEEAEQLLVDGNISFIKESQQEYKELFQVLMNNENSPVLFHCSAGKDRAGLAAALFLSSLDVEQEVVIGDYLLSGEYVREKYASLVEAMPILAPVFTVKREYIMAAFETIDKEYGGMDNFLTNYLGVDLEKMKALYTE